jgi:hypothetical protein
MGPLKPHSQAAAEVALAGEYMLQIDANLRRHFEGVRGVAFAHRGPLDASQEPKKGQKTEGGQETESD